MYAKIIQGRVVSLHESIQEMHPRDCALFVECPEGTQPGWPFEGGKVCGPDTEEGIGSAIVSITERYDLKRKGLKDRMAIALLQDGENEESVRTALAAEWQQTNADEELEILSLIGE